MSETTAQKPSGGKMHFNIIDFLIIIIFIGAIAGIALRAGLVKLISRTATVETARISFLIEDIQEKSGDYMKQGDSFYAVNYGCDLGTLESRQVMPAEAYINDINGNIIKTHTQNQRIDVRGTLLCEGAFSEEGFLLAGTNFIAPSTSIHMRSNMMDVWITVISIEKVETENTETGKS